MGVTRARSGGLGGLWCWGGVIRNGRRSLAASATRVGIWDRVVPRAGFLRCARLRPQAVIVDLVELAGPITLNTARLTLTPMSAPVTASLSQWACR